MGGEASDVLSAISNEECSVASEIFDKPECGQTLGDILQVSKQVSKVICSIIYLYI